MTEPRYCWAESDEAFVGDFATREEALEEARAHFSEERHPDGPMRVEAETGVLVPLDVRAIVARYADEMIDHLQQAAYDECGEIAFSWLNETPGIDIGDRVLTRAQVADLGDALADAVLAWLARHGHEPRCHTVAAVVRHEIDLDPLEEDECGTA